MTKTIFVIKGSGEKKRNHNIQTVKKLIEKGESYEQIWLQVCFYITSRTFDEYYRIASQLIQREKQVEQTQ